MHPGFRYHLASLMAVFFGLLLGILIGAALYQDSGLVEEQGHLIAQMEQHFHELQLNLGLLEEQIDFHQKIGAQLRDFIIKDQLAAADPVFLLETGVQWDWRHLEAALGVAGANWERLKATEVPFVQAGFLVIPIGKELDPAILEELNNREKEGAHLSFIWPVQHKPSLPLSPNSLQIDCADTVLGEMALVLGLAQKATGLFGIGQEAQALFP